jgi:hypothetical protein
MPKNYTGKRKANADKPKGRNKAQQNEASDEAESGKEEDVPGADDPPATAFPALPKVNTAGPERNGKDTDEADKEKSLLLKYKSLDAQLSEARATIVTQGRSLKNLEKRVAELEEQVNQETEGT